jgi:hypothetical protein
LNSQQQNVFSNNQKSEDIGENLYDEDNDDDSLISIKDEFSIFALRPLRLDFKET